MAKSKKRSPDKSEKHSEAPAQDQDNGGAEEREQTATAVEAPPEPQRPERRDRDNRDRGDRDSGGSGGGGGGREGGHDDVSAIDAETHA